MTRKYDVPAWKQLHLVRLALRHDKTTKADVAVLAEIVQRYHGAYGNGWASHDMLADNTGVTNRSVIRAKRKLEKLDLVTVLSQGRKGRSTVYLPNFDLITENGDKHDTEINSDTDVTEYTALGDMPVTETDQLGDTLVTPSYLQYPVYKTGILERDIDTAPASPPLSSGLLADDAGRAIDGFDELYKAYDYRRNRAEAKAGYQAINPDAGLHAEITASALVWRERWAAQNKPDAPRYTLAKWLERECYLEDPPAGYAKQKPEAKPKQKTGVPKMSTTQKNSVYKIENVIVEKEGGYTYLTMETLCNGKYSEDVSIVLEADSAKAQEEGQKQLQQLYASIGTDGVKDLNDLVGRTFHMNEDYDFISPS